MCLWMPFFYDIYIYIIYIPSKFSEWICLQGLILTFIRFLHITGFDTGFVLITCVDFGKLSSFKSCPFNRGEFRIFPSTSFAFCVLILTYIFVGYLVLVMNNFSLGQKTWVRFFSANRYKIIIVFLYILIFNCFMKISCLATKQFAFCLLIFANIVAMQFCLLTK